MGTDSLRLKRDLKMVFDRFGFWVLGFFKQNSLGSRV